MLLKEEMWYQVYVSLGTNEALNAFQDTFLRYFEVSFPIVYKNNKYKQKSWITKDIKISCNKKRDLFIQYRENTGSNQAKNHYKTHCNILRKAIKEAKKQFFHKQIVTSSNKVKTTWQIITDNFGNTKYTDIIDRMKCGNVLLNNPKDIANAFNNYYTNITSSLNIKQNIMGTASLLLNNLKLDNIVQMEITPVSEIEVINIINCLKPKDSAGYDGISTKILKHRVHLISKPLGVLLLFLLLLKIITYVPNEIIDHSGTSKI
jgi:hypothetical protein